MRAKSNRLRMLVKAGWKSQANEREKHAVKKGL